jgi:hypothetical protein
VGAMQSNKDRLLLKVPRELPQANELQSAPEMYDQEEIDGFVLRQLFIKISENIGPEQLNAIGLFTDKMKSNERFRNLLIRKLHRSRPDLAIQFEEFKKFYVSRISAYKVRRLGRRICPESC